MDYSNAVSSITTTKQKIYTALSEVRATLASFRIKLIKSYHRPFLPSDLNNPDIHEALSAKDLHIAYDWGNGTIILDATVKK